MQPSEKLRQVGIVRTEPVTFGTLSPLSRLILAGFALAVSLASLAHAAAAIVFVAPSSNVAMEQHGDAINDYVRPEFTRNWRLFAPNPPQVNVHVEARAQTRRADGALVTTQWVDLTEQDNGAIRHQLLPSVSNQAQLRRAWRVFRDTHDEAGTPLTRSAALTEAQLRRLVLRRLEGAPGVGTDLGAVRRVQVRTASASVAAPPWESVRRSTAPVRRELPWWTVRPEDLPGETAGTAAGENR
ncbi:DUF5819 family protein [Streptomyces sp. DSM 44917]|uniref:DUF5819 family protein n=1 Tax=Streptomyces boetiae TaxID=3075541 RepID=A0ABU2L8Y4_9ACTN|nr:DUF5819 family protein [Streptomyces sp. DSM 44917]MDT0307962.1 DUF5819 family protein [Streptomyces sp. DSM 44917]